MMGGLRVYDSDCLAIFEAHDHLAKSAVHRDSNLRAARSHLLFSSKSRSQITGL